MMCRSTVVSFPNIISAGNCRQVQRDFFRDCGQGRVVFSLIDVDTIHQELLFRIITRNSIKNIVDIRRKPVFRRPSFVHSEVAAYFYVHQIKYIETALHHNSGIFTNSRLGEAFRLIENYLKSGLCLFLYDDDSVGGGEVDGIRTIMRQFTGGAVEMLPGSFR